MKKITLLFLFFFCSFANAQECEQVFSTRGRDDMPTRLTVNRTDINCYSGTLNSITIADAELGIDSSCGEYYSFSLNLDGVISSVCAEDLIGLDLMNFTTLIITSADEDEDSESVNIILKIVSDFTPDSVPACTSLISPLPNSVNAPITGILTWAQSAGSTGYRISVGTTSNGTEVVNEEDLGNARTYDIEGILNENTTYYVKIIPYNVLGNTTGCAESIFTTGNYVAGDFCFNAINLSLLTSPIDGSTYFVNNDSSPDCLGNWAPDIYYYIDVPNGSTLTIGQEANDYDSSNYVFYGSCENSTTIACYDDPDYTAVNWANETGVTQRVYWVQDGLQDQMGTFRLAWSITDCINPVATFSVISLCSQGSDEFNIEANITSLGSANSVTISDNFIGTTQTINSPQIVTFGPYANTLDAVIIIVNDQNELCYITSDTLTQINCPPTNDTCATAIDLDSVSSPLSATTDGATDEIADGCLFNSAKDVFYKLVVENGVTLEIIPTSEDYYPISYVFYGDCDLKTTIACQDNGPMPVTWTNLTGSDQTVYWVQDGYQGAPFTLTFSKVLSVDENQKNLFKTYPNPVIDFLHLSYIDRLSSISIFNMLGQKVLEKELDTDNASIDVSNLPEGHYIANITSGSNNAKIKIIKQ